MSTKFTPGEWRVCELTRRYGVYDSSGTSIAKIDGAYGVAMERRKADAHLIAAAPMLYEALDRILNAEDATQYGVDNDNRDARYRELAMALQDGRAALKAARGES